MVEELLGRLLRVDFSKIDALFLGKLYILKRNIKEPYQYLVYLKTNFEGVIYPNNCKPTHEDNHQT